MNTGYGFFNLAVAIRDMRPSNNHTRPQLPAADESLLPRIEYSLLTVIPVVATMVTETEAPGFSVTGTVTRILGIAKKPVLLAN